MHAHDQKVTSNDHYGGERIFDSHNIIVLSALEGQVTEFHNSGTSVAEVPELKKYNVQENRIK